MLKSHILPKHSHIYCLFLPLTQVYDAQITVHSIAITDEADPQLDDLATSTGGLSFMYSGGNESNAINEAFLKIGELNYGLHSIPLNVFKGDIVMGLLKLHFYWLYTDNVYALIKRNICQNKFSISEYSTYTLVAEKVKIKSRKSTDRSQLDTLYVLVAYLLLISSKRN